MTWSPVHDAGVLILTLAAALTVGYLWRTRVTPHRGLTCTETAELIDHNRALIDTLTTCSDPTEGWETYSIEGHERREWVRRPCQACRHCHNRVELNREAREATT